MTLSSLISLQAVDLELRHVRAELAELPKRTAAARAAEQTAAGRLGATRKSIADEEALRRRQELDIAGHRTKMAKLQGQLDGATSTAQVTALQHQLDFTRAAIGTLEEEEFVSMERTETLEGDVTGLTAALASAETVRARAETVEAETTSHHRAAEASLEGERGKLRHALLNPPADWPATTTEAPAALALYDRVARSKGTGLAEAVPDASGGGQCSGCRMRVRPQRWQDLASREHANELYTCETCGRVLFFDSRRNAPGEQPEIDRLHAALASK